MKVKNGFCYAYPNGYGLFDEGEKKVINVDLEKYEGQGIAFRANVDFKAIPEYEFFSFSLSVNGAVNIVVEFKTEASNGTAASYHSICYEGKVENDYIKVKVPKLLSPLKEICICVLRSNNNNEVVTAKTVEIKNVEII